MPRHKYAKVNRLDKLHRQQKAALRQQIDDAKTRAVKLEETLRTMSEPSSSQSLPYHIGRTKTNNLPVYEHTKSGGSKQVTIVQKLSGDLSAVQRELLAILRLPEVVTDGKGRKKETVSINRLNQHITIKGWRGEEVKKWAQVRGF